jgi:hypothetical protein
MSHLFVQKTQIFDLIIFLIYGLINRGELTKDIKEKVVGIKITLINKSNEETSLAQDKERVRIKMKSLKPKISVKLIKKFVKYFFCQ